MDRPGRHIDLVSAPKVGDTPSEALSDDRRFLGIQFACCSVYTRVYVNQDGSAYEGKCPGCGKKVKLVIGPGGSDQRFFTAY